MSPGLPAIRRFFVLVRALLVARPSPNLGSSFMTKRLKSMTAAEGIALVRTELDCDHHDAKKMRLASEIMIPLPIKRGAGLETDHYHVLPLASAKLRRRTMPNNVRPPNRPPA